MIKNKKGYTLTEVLVTVLLLGILASIALPQYTKVVEKQKGTEMIQLLSALTQSQERYFAVNEVYTRDFALLDADIVDFNTKKRASGNMLNTKSFTIQLSADTSEAGAKITATRKGSQSYIIERNNTTGVICCGNDSTEDSDICDVLDIEKRCS